MQNPLTSYSLPSYHLFYTYFARHPAAFQTLTPPAITPPFFCLRFAHIALIHRFFMRFLCNFHMPTYTKMRIILLPLFHTFICAFTYPFTCIPVQKCAFPYHCSLRSTPHKPHILPSCLCPNASRLVPPSLGFRKISPYLPVHFSLESHAALAPDPARLSLPAFPPPALSPPQLRPAFTFSYLPMHSCPPPISQCDFFHSIYHLRISLKTAHSKIYTLFA